MHDLASAEGEVGFMAFLREAAFNACFLLVKSRGPESGCKTQRLFQARLFVSLQIQLLYKLGKRLSYLLVTSMCEQLHPEIFPRSRS